MTALDIGNFCYVCIQLLIDILLSNTINKVRLVPSQINWIYSNVLNVL